MIPCDFVKYLVQRNESKRRISQGPFPAVEPLSGMAGRNPYCERITTDPDHAELSKLLLGVDVWLHKGFARFAISVMFGAFHLEPIFRRNISAGA